MCSGQYIEPILCTLPTPSNHLFLPRSEIISYTVSPSETSRLLSNDERGSLALSNNLSYTKYSSFDDRIALTT